MAAEAGALHACTMSLVPLPRTHSPQPTTTIHHAANPARRHTHSIIRFRPRKLTENILQLDIVSMLTHSIIQSYRRLGTY